MRSIGKEYMVILDKTIDISTLTDLVTDIGCVILYTNSTMQPLPDFGCLNTTNELECLLSTVRGNTGACVIPTIHVNTNGCLDVYTGNCDRFIGLSFAGGVNVYCVVLYNKQTNKLICYKQPQDTVIKQPGAEMLFTISIK